jgi:hypothetical protein
MKGIVDYRYIIFIIVILSISIFSLSMLLEDDDDTVIKNDNITKEIKQQEPEDDDSWRINKNLDKNISKIDNVITTKKQTNNETNTTKAKQTRFVVAKTTSDDSLFLISIISMIDLKIGKPNGSIGGVLNLDNISSHFTLPFNGTITTMADNLSIEVKYKDRVFKSNAKEIFDKYDNIVYALEIDLIDDFMNIYLTSIKESDKLVSPISEHENQMILDKINKSIKFDKEFLDNHKGFTKIIDE